MTTIVREVLARKDDGRAMIRDLCQSEADIDSDHEVEAAGTGGAPRDLRTTNWVVDGRQGDRHAVRADWAAQG
jgi:hypothetical protein